MRTTRFWYSLQYFKKSLNRIYFYFFFVNFHFFYRQHIHHITCTEQDKHIISVNDSYYYLRAQHITTFFLKSIVIVITTLFPPNHYLFGLNRIGKISYMMETDLLINYIIRNCKYVNRNIYNKPWQFISTDYWADDTPGEGD